jgi:hypothetical protein
MQQIEPLAKEPPSFPQGLISLAALHRNESIHLQGSNHSEMYFQEQNAPFHAFPNKLRRFYVIINMQ